MTSNKPRLLSGIQSTGKMHLGNYLGAVSNWVKQQHDYDAFYFIADLHSLTTVYENPAQLREDKFQLAVDLLSSGLDPDACSLFYQSDVPGHSELHLILSMITPLPWLERVPTYKDKKDAIKNKDLNTYGFLGYPTLQTADIILYKATVVPVGKDQIPHLELAREITRRFNHFYGEVFPEPEVLLTETPTLLGTDGRKMSKSYDNTLPLSDTEEETTKKMMKMKTDPQRLRRDDPGDPDVCAVYSYHKLFNSEDNQTRIAENCRAGTIGCVDCKKDCAAVLNHFLAPIRERRRVYENDRGEVERALKIGAEKANAVANDTMSEVRKAVGL